MFKDLKEYQEITQLYHDSVNISEEQRAINTAIAEANFTDEEIIYLDENFDELWESELSILAEEAISDCLVEENLNEEQLQEIVKKMAPKTAKAAGGAIGGIGGMLKKGFSAVKKRIPQGVKDTVKGGISVAKSAMKKAAPVIKAIPKVGLAAAGLGGAAVLGGKVIGALRNRGKKQREIIQKAKDDAAIKKGIEDAKKTGIPNNTAVQGGAMSQKAREQAAFNRGERKARVDLKDPTLNDNMKKKTETETETKPMSKRDKFNAKFIKKDKGKGFVKRGTAPAQRAENKEKAKLRAQAMAKARIEAKKKAEAEVKEEYDAYDMVLMYLNATEQASTVEEANYIMTEMDQQTIGEIVKQVKEALSE